MPELPEVENIVRHLRPKIVGKKIVKIEVNEPRLFRDHRDIGEVQRAVVGERIVDCRRTGKNIFIDLTGGKSLTLHLMMTGRLLLDPAESSPYDRVRFVLSGGTGLIFNDIRKFGRCRLVRREEKICGEDALKISFAKFRENIVRRKVPLKSVLLNQSVVAGIGNIYADEILWDAGVHPQKSPQELTEKETKKIFVSMKRILNRAIASGGTTFRNYQKPDGSPGKYFALRNVYQREGERCKRDGGIIIKIKLGGRATHYCPKHQR